MKTQSFIQTKINAGSIEERDRRIHELTIRGYSVHSFYENIVESRESRTGLVNGRKSVKHKYDGGVTRATYGAVMRKAKC